jgi:signal transduction histidine kinase
MVRLETTLADDMTISLEELTLQRILFPLLDNAVKNGGDQPIKVKAWNENGRLMLTVEDRGCGIPAEEAEHIFERFVKLDTFKNGLGLGLTYSRTVARRAGGDVNLDTSYPGPGARFKVMI